MTTEQAQVCVRGHILDLSMHLPCRRLGTHFATTPCPRTMHKQGTIDSRQRLVHISVAVFAALLAQAAPPIRSITLAAAAPPTLGSDHGR